MTAPIASAPPELDRPRAAPAWVILFGFFCLLCAHAWQHYPFIADDALITLRYAARLLQGDGLTWTDGRPVEGYSNLLWLLLVAMLGYLGMDLIDAVRLLGVLGMGAALFALTRWHVEALRVSGYGEMGVIRLMLFGYAPLAAALLFFTTAAPVAVWMVGGLEQPLYVALLAFAIPITARIIDDEAPRKAAILGLSCLLGAMSVTRPDGPLFTVAALISIYLGRMAAAKPRLSLGDMALLLSLPCLCYGGQTAFRLWYYGEWVANTAYVKVSPSLLHFRQGLDYLLGGMKILAPLSWLAAASVLLLVFVTPALGIPLLVMGGLWALYVAFIGGDVFIAYRHILPLAVLFAFALGGGLQWLAGRLQALFAMRVAANLSARLPAKTITAATVMATAITAAALSALFIPYLKNQASVFLSERHPHNTRSKHWVWEGRLTALLLKQAFHDKQPLMAIDAAGGMAYWSELPALDTFGLNDYYLPRNRPADFGQGWIGHELCDGAYLLRRKPDLMVWNKGRMDSPYCNNRQLKAHAEFHSHYTPIRVLSRDPDDPRRAYRGIVWARKYDSKIGVRVSESEIRVPAFLFNGNAETLAYINDRGRLVIAVSAARPAEVTLDLGIIPSIEGRRAIVVAARANAPAPTSAAGPAEGGGIAARMSRLDDALLLELTSQSATDWEVEEVILATPAAPL